MNNQTRACDTWSEVLRTCSIFIALAETNRYAEGSDNGYCWSSSDLHRMDSIPGVLHCSNVFIDLFVRESELVEDLELSSAVFDGLEYHSGQPEFGSCQ